MRRTKLALTLGMLGFLGGCAALVPDRPEAIDAAIRLDRGLDALEAGAYQEALDHLRWVYIQCGGHVRGSQALAGLAALELDPRNPHARPALGTDLLARSMRDPGAPAWVRPLYETTYLLARSLGAPEPTTADPPAADTAPARADTAGLTPADTLTTDRAWVAEAEAADQRAPVGAPAGDGRTVHGCGDRVPEVDERLARELPTLPGRSLAALLIEAEAARDTAAARSAQLASELAELRVRLAETEQELERIRRTLRP